MIKLCDNFNVSDYKSESFYCAILTKIYSLSLMNGNLNTLLYKIYDSDDNVKGFILSSNRELNVCADELFDKEEITEFLSFVGYKSVLSNINLPLNDKKSCGYIMKHTGIDCGKSNAQIISCEEIKDIYPLLTDCFEIKSDFSEWFCDISHKVRHGFADISAVKVNDKFISCAISMYKTPFSCIINGVCVNKNFRSNGYGRSSLNALVYRMTQENINDIFVFCEEGKTEMFYEKQGFEKAGRWYEYVR